MITSNRRIFLGGLSSSLLALGVGTGLGRRAMAWPASFSGDDLPPLSFGDLESLAALMQETEPGKLQRILIEKLRNGTSLRTLVAAGSLANARTFGGEDYTGYHCMMAMMPAWQMSQQLPVSSRPLPVLKVLHRNATRIQENGGRSGEVLRALPDPEPLEREVGLRRLRRAFLDRDVEGAELAFCALTRTNTLDAYNDLQTILQENLDVHRVVLAWRAYEVMQLTGEQHAETLLRQSVRFCVADEKRRVQRGRPEPPLRSLLPELLEVHQLVERPAGTRRATDREVDELCHTVFSADKQDAARAMAAALADGLSLQDAGEALSLAGNALLLCDPGRGPGETSAGKPRGSVHGASVGVHASDSARAWRNIASVSSHRNAVASMIAGAYHTAGQSDRVGKQTIPYAERLDEVRKLDEPGLRACLDGAIRERDQLLACAATHTYAEQGFAERPLFDLLIGYATSQDGALHAEKFFLTVCEEYESARPAFRRRHLVALARVTASEYGWQAPGYAEAREQLGV